MLNINKVKLGYVFSVMAFTLTVLMSQSAGFYEMNGILRYAFNNFNGYQVILLYGFLWAGIFALYEWANTRINQYQMNYIANIILFIGFFDFLHDAIIVIQKVYIG